MKAAWYEKQGTARDVLVVGEMPDPEPGPGEVRVRVAASGINPGDVKKRSDAFGVAMPYPRVIPHSDGAGTIDRVGDRVAASRVGERVWCYGAHEVVRADGRSTEELAGRLRALAPGGIDHVVEVAFDQNIALDEEALSVGGSVAAYATGEPSPRIPFWRLGFKNVRVVFLGSDDFPAEAKSAAARDVNAALVAAWPGFKIGRRLPLSAIAEAHEDVEGGQRSGRVLLML